MELMNKEAMNPWDTEAIPRKVLPMFFLIDTSGSMAGEKIGSLNSAMEEVLLELADMSTGSIDAEIKMAVLEFSSGCTWQTPGLISVEKYGAWQTLKAGGVTDMGAACLELDQKLSRKGGYMVTPSGSFAPIVFLMSDGIPVDDFEKGLEKLKQNNWFKASLKIALAIGDDADENLLAKFTGNRELVVTVHDKEQLTKMIKTLSITSAAIGSKSRPVSTDGQSADPTILAPTVAERTLINAINGDDSQPTPDILPAPPSPLPPSPVPVAESPATDPQGDWEW